MVKLGSIELSYGDIILSVICFILIVVMIVLIIQVVKSKKEGFSAAEKLRLAAHYGGQPNALMPSDKRAPAKPLLLPIGESTRGNSPMSYLLPSSGVNKEVAEPATADVAAAPPVIGGTEKTEDKAEPATIAAAAEQAVAATTTQVAAAVQQVAAEQAPAATPVTQTNSAGMIEITGSNEPVVDNTQVESTASDDAGAVEVDDLSSVALNVSAEEGTKAGAGTLQGVDFHDQTVPDTSELPAVVQNGVVESPAKEGYSGGNTRVSPQFLNNGNFGVVNKYQRGGISESYQPNNLKRRFW